MTFDDWMRRADRISEFWGRTHTFLFVAAISAMAPVPAAYVVLLGLLLSLATSIVLLVVTLVWFAARSIRRMRLRNLEDMR